MEKFSQLPKPVKGGVAAGGAGGLLLTGMAIGGTARWVFPLVLILLLAVLLGGYLLWKAWKRKKQNARFGGELQQHSAASPRGISDPGHRARLDDLRKKFEQGVTEYRSRGKDLYTLPWYVIVGEPGSGKTEAIRHSNVGFPPGMQDEFQGVGGTINMNWWFTNYAVILDTAGRLMFEELKPGETSEWKEFLTLLKKHRPNCPINGLFLVIPSDSLIKDTAEDISKKAGKIAQQLDVIQRVLDVRFPVFVFVTKCDKVNGFREYFDGLTDPQLQHQMLGWSNPDSLDSPFRAELVDRHLEQVAQRLRKRRMGLLRDPVPENQIGRRTDEVDSLYSLPHSLGLLAPRLRRYLETIFVAGEWSAKPLFLRGIYFTSSMREGAALDEELANAIGLPVDELPEGKVWERERAYFLRDLFMEKVFREKGLVTRATNTSRMLRRQQFALLAAGSLALVIFLLVAWLGMRTLRSNVLTASASWKAVAQAGWHNNKVWKQSLVPLQPNGTYADATTNEVRLEGERPGVGAFHARLLQEAERKLPRNWLFPTLHGRYERDSLKAQRIVLETGVMKPLLDAAREKVNRELTRDAEAQKRLPDALSALIALEADLVAGARPELTVERAEKLLVPLMSFVSGQEVRMDANLTNLVGVVVRTYASGRDMPWPPPWISGAVKAPGNLANQPALRNGIDQCLRLGTNALQSEMEQWQKTAALRQALAEFKRREEALFQAAQGKDERRFAEAFKEHFPALTQAKGAIDAEVAKVRGLSFFQGGLSLTNAQQQFRALVLSQSGKALETVKTANAKALAGTTNQLFQEIQARLENAQAQLNARIKELAAADANEPLKEFDEAYLGKPGYAERWDVYQQGGKLLEPLPYASGRLVRDNGGQLDQFLNERLAPFKAAVTAYAGRFKPELTAAGNHLAGTAERTQRAAFVQAYLEAATSQLADKRGFPLLNVTTSVLDLEKLRQADKLLSFIAGDLRAPAFQHPSVPELAGWKPFTNDLAQLNAVAKAILGEEGIPMSCGISLAGQPADGEEWRATWRNIVLMCSGCPTSPERTESRAEVPLGTIPTIDEGLTVRIIKQANVANSDMQEFKAGEWGALALLLRHQGKKVDAGGLTWRVDWPVTTKEGRVVLPLVLKLSRRLPDLDTWLRK